MTLIKIANSFNAIERSLSSNVKLPLYTAYKLTKIKTQLQEEYNFYITRLQEYIDLYCIKDINGDFVLSDDQKTIKIKEELFDECKRKISELENMNIDIDDSLFVTLDEIEGLELSVIEMEALLPFIKE